LYIKQLDIANFRNYDLAHLEPCTGTNLIIGKNAQGKTNLIEAICYLSAARSFRTSKEADLLQIGASQARVRASIFSDRDYLIDVKFGSRREIYINNVKKRRTSELLGILQTVLFCPEDLSLVKEGAAARRKFIDTALCQLRPNYAVLLSEYGKLLQHKNRILKDYEKYPTLLDTIDDFSARMCQISARLIPYRVWFLDTLQTYAGKIHAEISSNTETLSIEYKTVSTVSDHHAGENDIYQQLWDHYRSHKTAEIASKSCLSGIHKDDAVIYINNLPARTYASQGQTRSAALAMKLGQRDLFHADTGFYPVLILDDVLSELDENRRNYILKGIHEGQVFITSCEERPGLSAEKIFSIDNGTITNL